MEIENDWPSENLTETIIINSNNYPILKVINLETECNMRVFLDVKNNIIEKNNQLYFANLMQALFKDENIEINVGMRFEREEDNNKEEQGDWIHFIKGIGQFTTGLHISIGDYVLNRLNLAHFRQELLRLNHLEIFHLQIGKDNFFNFYGLIHLGEALRGMTQLQDLSIIIGDNCSLEVNGAKELFFYGMKACKKIKKLKVHIGCNNCLKAEGMQILSETAGQLEHIIDFDLFIAKANDIGNEGMLSIASDLLEQHLSKSAKKLSLKIDDMEAIDMEIIVYVFWSIKRFTRLQDLSVDLRVEKKMNENSIKIIQDSLKRLPSLRRVSLNINIDPYAVTPRLDLLTRFQLTSNLQSLQLVIPPNNLFNNDVLSLFAMNLKSVQQLQVFSLEIQENNLEGNANQKRNESEDNRYGKKNQETTKQRESINYRRGIRDISKSLGTLKKLKKVQWIISTQNDVSDGGWEMLSSSRSLRDFRVKIGEKCRLQDGGLHSLSKISNILSLDCLRVEVDNENETSQDGWSNLLGSIRFEKMNHFNISIGTLNQCSGESLQQIAAAFERTSPRIEFLTLDFQDFNNIISYSVQQLADSLKSMDNLQYLVFRMPNNLDINRSALYSLSNNLKKMSHLKELRISFRIQNNGELSDEIRLCSAICSLRKLQNLNLQVEGNGSLKGSSIIGQVNSFKFPISLYENQSIVEFRTQNGLQFKMKFTKEYVSQEEVDNLADSLSLFGLASQQIVYLSLQIHALKQAENCPQFTQIISFLGGLKKCIKLKLEINSKFFSDVSLIQLVDNIVCMPFLLKLSLRLDHSTLPLKAAETLAAFFESSPRITKVNIIWKLNPNIDQSEAQFHLMSSILTCPNLKRFQVFFKSNSQIQLEFKNQPKIEVLPLDSFIHKNGEKIQVVTAGEVYDLVKKTNQNVPLQKSDFIFIMEDRRKPITDENLIYFGKFFMSRKLLQTIKLYVSQELFISTEVASIVQEGIMNQANLTDLHLEFTELCVVSGEGAVLLSQSSANRKERIHKTIKIQTDDTFSKNDVLSALVSILQDYNWQKKGDRLEITGTKFILTTEVFSSNRNPILEIRSPFYIALFQRIPLDDSEAIHLSQIVDGLSEFGGCVENLKINASENVISYNWRSFGQLSFLTSVSIEDKSPIASSRFFSLESSLSEMIHLKSLTLNLSHTQEENVSSQETIVPFGKCLNNLKEITQFTITLQDFNFGKDGGQALGQGIKGMSALQLLEINCINPQNLEVERIKYLCEVISQSDRIYQFNISFFGLHSSVEIPFFRLLKNHLLHKQNSLTKYSFEVNGEIFLAYGQHKKFSQSISLFELNQGISRIYELKLPPTYCFKSAFENEAVKKCTDILQVFYSSSSETDQIQNVTFVFDFNKLEQIEPNLIFLKTLFSVLLQEKRRVKFLTIDIKLSQNGQFQFIFESALKDIKLVDTFYLNLMNSYPYQCSFQELYSITSLDTLVHLKIVFTRFEDNLKQFRQRIIRKMKRLCHYELKN